MQIKAIQGNSLKEVILRSPRLKKLRDNPDQLALYVCGTQWVIYKKSIIKNFHNLSNGLVSTSY